MTHQLVIMDFTGAYEQESFYKHEWFEWVDCRDIPGTRYICDDEAKAKLQERIREYGPNGVHFIDSGNYHYMSKLWTDKIRVPFVLVVFDHHPDMQPTLFGDLMSCGCWVKEVLDTNKYLQKVVIVGASDELLKELSIQNFPVSLSGDGATGGANGDGAASATVATGSAKGDAAAVATGATGGANGNGAAAAVATGADGSANGDGAASATVAASAANGDDGGAAVAVAVNGLPPEYNGRIVAYSESSMNQKELWSEFAKEHVKYPVYISIDKDVLKSEDAVTDWDSGSMSLEQLTELLSRIVYRDYIIGVDICGECSDTLRLITNPEVVSLNDRCNKLLLKRLYCGLSQIYH